MSVSIAAARPGPIEEWAGFECVCSYPFGPHLLHCLNRNGARRDEAEYAGPRCRHGRIPENCMRCEEEAYLASGAYEAGSYDLH